MGVEELATHSVFAQYSALFYALPNGVAQAAATLGSNALGAGDAGTAKALVPLAYVLCILCGVLQGGALLSNRSRMGQLFSLDTEVIAMTSRIAPIFCIGYELSDVWKCAGMLYLRETGRWVMSPAPPPAPAPAPAPDVLKKVLIGGNVTPPSSPGVLHQNTPPLATAIESGYGWCVCFAN